MAQRESGAKGGGSTSSAPTMTTSVNPLGMVTVRSDINASVRATQARQDAARAAERKRIENNTKRLEEMRRNWNANH